MNISNVDLNLFAVLDAVLTERSVTRAAHRLHVTQSAVSNSLVRLREVLGDPLVVRSGRGLALTPRAELLAPVVAETLRTLDAAITGHRAFAAKAATRTFTLAAADNQQVCDVPRIAEQVARQMPRARLRIVSPDYLISSDGLNTGEIDVALGPSAAAKPPYLSRRAFVETGALVVRRKHPKVRGRMSRDLFNELRHIDVEVALGRTGVGHQVASESWRRQGIVRVAALTVPSFTAAAMAASRTDYVAAIPYRTARVFCQLLPLRMVATEFELPRIEMSLLWHARTEADEGSRFFRELILKCLGRVPVTRPGGRS